MFMSNTLFLFAGKTGSGKTVLSKAFSSHFKLKRSSFGDIVRVEARKLGFSDVDKAELQKIGQHLVDYDVTRFCKMVIDDLDLLGQESGVVDGLRHQKVLDEMVKQNECLSVRIIYVSVSDSERFLRLSDSRGWTLSQCESYDNDPTEIELDTVLMKSADYILYNDGSVLSSLEGLLSWAAGNECTR